MLSTAKPPLASAHHFALLSVLTAILTIALKTLAWWLTGSVGLLSDALESFVNLAGAGFALWMLLIAATPPDERHPWGHSKAEYFSSGFEGTLIFIAAIAIAATAVPRLFKPSAPKSLDIGLVLSALSAVLNYLCARILARAGQRLRSVALTADARHLMTDVWTTAGVVLGVLLIPITGWLWLDPLLALLVAALILKEGFRLMRDAVAGLMDEAMPPAELAVLHRCLDEFAPRGLSWHRLRTRRAGHQRFVQVDVLAPPEWTVEYAHSLADELEAKIAECFPGALVSTHVEPSTCALPPAAESMPQAPQAMR